MFNSWLGSRDDDVIHWLSLLVRCITLLLCCSSGSGASECLQEENAITCPEVPGKFSLAVQRVYIEGKNIEHDRMYFDIELWENITVLDIKTDKGKYFRHRPQPIFKNLTNLKTLGIHVKTLEWLDNETFLGLQTLKTLDLSNCIALGIYELSKAFLLDSSLMNLENLYLNNMKSTTVSPMILNIAFLENLVKRPIRSLNLSGVSVSKTELTNTTFQKICNSLEMLNISNTLGFWGSCELNSDLHCVSLKVIDASQTQLRSIAALSGDNTPYSSSMLFDLSNFPSLHSLYLNQLNVGILDHEIRINGGSLTCLKCNTERIASVFLKENNLRWLNVSCINCSSIGITLLDMSSNGLEYISPGLFTESKIEDFNLHNNRLHVMQYFPDFQKFFKQLPHLRKIILSKNDLTYVPDNLFNSNVNLEYIDLSSNRLSSLTLSLKNQNKLRHLDLKNNKFRYIMDEEFAKFSLFVQERFNATQGNFHVDLSANDFACNCEGSQFIKWIHIYLSPKLPPDNTIQCTIDGKRITVNEDAVLASQNNCSRTLRIIVAVCLSLCLFIVVVITSFLFVTFEKRSRQSKQRQRYIEQVENENAHKQILFYIFCSKDLEFLQTQVCPVLAEHLKDLIDTNIVLCYDLVKKYRLGQPLVNEADRCIKQSCVLAFLVSRASCECKRCLYELRLASQGNKPVVAIFKEQVEEDRMPPIVRLMVKSANRAKFVKDKQNIRLDPTPRRFCKILLDLAAAQSNN